MKKIQIQYNKQDTNKIQQNTGRSSASTKKYKETRWRRACSLRVHCVFIEQHMRLRTVR